MYKKLRETRESRKITCEHLSCVLGLKIRSAYHKKENGLVPFTLHEAKLIADYFDKPIDYIFLISTCPNMKQ